MLEKVKRLQPVPETLRMLFLRSGNLCAFPNCSHLMMTADGTFVGQICHIEGALEGGERFNPHMTNEQRRHESNLLLMCHAHHKITDDVNQFPTAAMRQIKQNHERRFSDPSYIMLQSIQDWTSSSAPSGVKNLARISQSLKWSLSSEELRENIEELNSYIETFHRIPLETRHFLGQIAYRMQYASKTFGLPREGAYEFMPVKDVESVFNLSSSQVNQIFSQMRHYRLGAVEEISCEGINPPYGAFLFDLPSGWPLWIDLAEFCANENIDIREISNEMKFEILDI
ncbi:hypothetical protein [Gluconacetobacter tumulicola]|nr:hypothetical protein [Gluconacetobacter tumulicola]